MAWRERCEMQDRSARATDPERLAARMPILIGRILQIGVAVAAAVTAVGLVLLLSGRGGGAVIELGVLILVATPVARVAFTVIWFARERDRLYAGMALFVLVVLVLGLLGLPG